VSDPDYSPAFQDEYQRLWRRDALIMKFYREALEAIDATRIDGALKNAAERAYFDCKAITMAALDSETPLAAILGAPSAIEIRERHRALVAELRSVTARR